MRGFVGGTVDLSGCVTQYTYVIIECVCFFFFGGGGEGGFE